MTWRNCLALDRSLNPLHESRNIFRLGLRKDGSASNYTEYSSIELPLVIRMGARNASVDNVQPLEALGFNFCIASMFASGVALT